MQMQKRRCNLFTAKYLFVTGYIRTRRSGAGHGATGRGSGCGRSRVGTWMVNDAAERQVALEGVGGFKTPPAPAVTLFVLHQR